MFTDYQILKAESPENLAGDVSNHINDGWQPIGGVCVSVIEKNIGSRQY